MKTVSIFFCVTLVLQFTFACSAETNNVASSARDRLPPEIKSFLESADEFTLLSLDPRRDYEHKLTNTFEGFTILGQTDIKKRVVITNLVEALDKGIGDADAWGMCFDPRHGIRAKKKDGIVELVICFGLCPTTTLLIKFNEKIKKTSN